jgi:hypothetical protein
VTVVLIYLQQRPILRLNKKHRHTAQRCEHSAFPTFHTCFQFLNSAKLGSETHFSESIQPTRQFSQLKAAYRAIDACSRFLCSRVENNVVGAREAM